MALKALATARSSSNRLGGLPKRISQPDIKSAAATTSRARNARSPIRPCRMPASAMAPCLVHESARTARATDAARGPFLLVTANQSKVQTPGARRTLVNPIGEKALFDDFIGGGELAPLHSITSSAS